MRRSPSWDPPAEPDQEIAFTPARVLMQDFTGVPAVVDLAAMRDAMAAWAATRRRSTRWCPATWSSTTRSRSTTSQPRPSDPANVKRAEYQRNRERYEFLQWGQKAFHSFRVVPPGTGIVHQVNLEYLAQVVRARPRRPLAYPDTLVGTDSTRR